MSTYRVIYCGGDHTDTDQLPAMSRDIWAIVNLDIGGGGDAYQELVHTLGAQPGLVADRPIATPVLNPVAVRKEETHSEQ